MPSVLHMSAIGSWRNWQSTPIKLLVWSGPWSRCRLRDSTGNSIHTAVKDHSNLSTFFSVIYPVVGDVPHLAILYWAFFCRNLLSIATGYEITHERQVVLSVLAVSLEPSLQLAEVAQGNFLVVRQCYWLCLNWQGHFVMAIKSLVDPHWDFGHETSVFIWEGIILRLRFAQSSVYLGWIKDLLAVRL